MQNFGVRRTQIQTDQTLLPLERIIHFESYGCAVTFHWYEYQLPIPAFSSPTPSAGFYMEKGFRHGFLGRKVEILL